MYTQGNIIVNGIELVVAVHENVVRLELKDDQFIIGVVRPNRKPSLDMFEGVSSITIHVPKKPKLEGVK